MQREVAKRIGGRDVERNFEETVAVGEVHARSSVKRPGVVHRSVANRLKRIVHQFGLDGRVGVAVKAWEGGGQEVRRTNNGDVDVRTRWSQRGRVAGEVVRRVGEVNAQTVRACTVLTVPRPVVVKGGVAVLHDWALRVSGLACTKELSVLVNVDLQRNGVLVPRVVGTVGDLSNDLQGFTGVHLGDDFTANRAVGVRAVNRTTRWQVAVAAVHQRNVPVGAVAAKERSQCSRLAGQACGCAVPRLGVRLERRHVVVIHTGSVEGGLVEQRRPVAEGAVAVVDGGVVVVNRAQAVKDERSFDVHAVHDTDGERLGLVAVQVGERPLRGQFRRNSGDDLNVAGGQTRVRVIVPNDVAVAVQHHVVRLGQVVPRDFFIAARDLTDAVVGGGVPLHLLPCAADTQILDKGQRSPTRCVGPVAVVAQASEVGGRREVAEQTTEDGEGDRGVPDAVVKEAAVPVCRIVGLEVQPERLFVAAEVGPCRVIDRHVGFSTYEVGLRLVAVEHEHLRDLGIHTVGGVVTDGQILGVEELTHAEVATGVGQDVDGLDGRGVVGRPFNVHLHGKLRCRLNHTGDGVQPVDVPGKDGRALRIQPEVVRQVEGDVGGRLVIGVKDTVVVVVPIRGQVSVFDNVEVRVGSGVVVVVRVDDVGSGG